jgi:hypothetical protein
VAVWIPVAKALKRFGPVVGPMVLDKFRRDAKPYWDAYQQARRIDGYIGAWQDDDGKHWVVLDAQRSAITSSFPPLNRKQQRVALESLDPAQLQYHRDTALARLEDAPAKLRDALPSRRDEDR